MRHAILSEAKNLNSHELRPFTAFRVTAVS